MIKCIQCGNNTKNAKFCSRSCYGLFSSTKVLVLLPRKKRSENCKNCGKIVYGEKIFCNKSCAATFNNKERVRSKTLKMGVSNIKNEKPENRIKKIKEIRFCEICGKKVKGSSGYGFCSSQCFQVKKSENLVEKWKKNEVSGSTMSGEIKLPIRKYLMKLADGKCSVCKRDGWLGGKIPLEIDHENGNHEDNSFKNLRVICCNCHAQTSSFCARNIGFGRKNRKKNSDKLWGAIKRS